MQFTHTTGMKKAIAILSAAAICIAAALVIYLTVTFTAVSLSSDKLTADNELTVFAEDNRVIGNTVGKSEYTDFPEDLKNSFIAVEDKRFYEHNGIDFLRLGGALIQDIKTMSFAQGASTISSQLIKNTHLTNEKTITRKLQESKLTLELEKEYSKEQILTMYLNVIYFGNGIYGVKQAANVFFNKSVSELSLVESASLAAVVVNPATYSPLLNPQQNRERRNSVLRLMREQNYIDEQEYANAVDKDLILSDIADKNIYTSYVANAIKEASELTGLSERELRKNGYVITTACDRAAQENLYSSMSNEDLLPLNSYSSTPDRMGMITDNKTRKITAYFSNSVIYTDNVRRQPGSVIKPIAVYAAGLEKGVLLPETPILDEETSFGEYSPSNYGGTFAGWTDARRSLAHSYNIPAVKFLEYVGLDYSFDYTQRLGLRLVDTDKNLALALGGISGATMRELSGAYATFANQGNYARPYFVVKITDKNGNVIFNRNVEEQTVTGSDTAYLLSSMLRDAVTDGTARKLSALSFPVYAKTGTVAAKGGNSDAWCAGYTSSETFVMWLGNLSMTEEQMPDNGVTGGSYPTLIAKQYLSNTKKSALAIPQPNTVSEVNIDTYSLENEHILTLAGEYTPDAYRASILCGKAAKLPASTRFELPRVGEVTLKRINTGVTISFEAEDCYGYEIYRVVNSSRELVNDLTEAKGLTEITDVGGYGIVRYQVTPYAIVNGERRYGLSAQTNGIFMIPWVT